MNALKKTTGNPTVTAMRKLDQSLQKFALENTLHLNKYGMTLQVDHFGEWFSRKEAEYLRWFFVKRGVDFLIDVPQHGTDQKLTVEANIKLNPVCSTDNDLVFNVVPQRVVHY